MKKSKFKLFKNKSEKEKAKLFWLGAFLNSCLLLSWCAFCGFILMFARNFEVIKDFEEVVYLCEIGLIAMGYLLLMATCTFDKITDKIFSKVFRKKKVKKHGK